MITSRRRTVTSESRSDLTSRRTDLTAAPTQSTQSHRLDRKRSSRCDCVLCVGVLGARFTMATFTCVYALAKPWPQASRTVAMVWFRVAAIQRGPTQTDSAGRTMWLWFAVTGACGYARRGAAARRSPLAIPRAVSAIAVGHAMPNVFDRDMRSMWENGKYGSLAGIYQSLEHGARPTRNQ